MSETGHEREPDVSDRFRVPEQTAVRVAEREMRETVEAIFRALGLTEVAARRSADVLLYADLRGIESHGVSNMMPYYVAWFERAELNPAPVWRVLREAPAVASVDADRGLGLALGAEWMALALDKAEACGVGSVAVTNSGHVGACAYFAQLALERGMIGVAMTVGGIAVPPTFGARPMLGLDPIAVAVPARHEPPFVFDASMSSVAGNKIRIARRLGSTIGPGWIAAPDGTPIMQAGPVPDDFMILPLGGTREIGSHKGYGLSVVVEVLSALLSGGPPRLSGREDFPHHFAAWRIDAFTDPEAFKDEMDAFLRALRETPPAPGHERVLYAGLPEHETEIERRERGIPYHPDVLEELRKTATRLGATHRLG